MIEKFKRLVIVKKNGNKNVFTLEDFEKVLNNTPALDRKYSGDSYKLAKAFLKFHSEIGNSGYFL